MTSLVPRSWFGDFHDLTDLHRDLETLFQGVFRPSARAPREPEAAEWWPSAESWVKDGKLTVRLDLPGVDPKNVDVSLTGNTLTIRGERKTEERSEDEGYVAREVRYGTFERVMNVPEGIDPEAVTARYTNGVLDVTLRLPPEVPPRKVPIQVDDQPADASKKVA